MTLKLTDEEVHLITEYRRLQHGEIRIRKLHGQFDRAETVVQWDKRDLERPRRKLREIEKKP